MAFLPGGISCKVVAESLLCLTFLVYKSKMNIRSQFNSVHLILKFKIQNCMLKLHIISIASIRFAYIGIFFLGRSSPSSNARTALHVV